MRCTESVEVSVLKILSNTEKAIFRGYLNYYFDMYYLHLVLCLQGVKGIFTCFIHKLFYL